MWGIAMGSGARLRLHGRMPEKFIRVALGEGVRIGDCRRIDADCTLMHVPMADVRRVCALAEKYHLRCEVLGCDGPSAWADTLLRRRTALIGVVALLCVSALLLSRVWMVEVLPVDGADEDIVAQVRQVLVESGAVPGASVRGIDRAQLRSRIISSVPGAAYVSVRRRGVCIVAEVSSAVEAPQTYDIGRVRNVVAMHDGVITRVDVYAGTAAVQPGDTVRRGDVLIWGQERISDESTVPVAADGAAMARIWQSTDVYRPMQQVQRTPTGRQSVGEAIVAGDWEVVLTPAQEYESEVCETEFLPIGGLFVPVGIRRTTHIECAETLVRQDEDALKRLLLEEAEAILDKNMPFGARVVDKWQDYSMINSGELYMKLTRELEADIAAAGRAEQ